MYDQELRLAFARAQLNALQNHSENHAHNANIPQALHSPAHLRFSPYPQPQTSSPTVQVGTSFTTTTVHNSLPPNPQKRPRTETSNHDQTRVLGSNNKNQPRPLSEVLSDLEGFLQLQKELIMNPPLQRHFSAKWFEDHLCSKINELESSPVDESPLGGIKNLNLLVRIHRELTALRIQDIDPLFTMAISLQKASVDSHGLANRVRRLNNTDDPSQPYGQKYAPAPMMSGAAPRGGAETFAIEAIATKDQKVSGGYREDLYLVWEEDSRAFRCVKGHNIITSIFPDLCIVADEVTEFRCSKESTKVLIKSNVDADTEMFLFINMADTKAVFRLFDQLQEHSSKDIELHFEDR